MAHGYHNIIIDNFKQDETVNYSVIILKGHIKNKSDTACPTEYIYLNPETTNTCFKLAENRFKVLAELQLGKNLINLKSCCSTTTIIINFVTRKSKLQVLPLYIICQGHDGTFQAPENEPNNVQSACARIELCTKLLQSVFAEKLYEENQRRKTFIIKNSCQVFHSALNYQEARQMTQDELWTSLGREILNSELNDSMTKFLGFLSCTKYCGERYKENSSHDDIIKITQAYVALGGGGLALFGGACLFTWPENLSQVIESFVDSSVINRKQFLDDSCYRGTYGTCFSTTLGSVLHELCHTFDLGHTETGIMGRGFDNIYKVFIIQKNESCMRQHFKNSIHFEEKMDLRLSERISDTKKSFLIRDYPNGEDGVFWTKSCIILLSYHLWFNDFEHPTNVAIKFDSPRKLLSSLAGLRVIELRNQEDGMVLKDWIFDGKILKYSFHISQDEVSLLRLNTKSTMLIVEDNVGNILRQVINI